MPAIMRALFRLCLALLAILAVDAPARAAPPVLPPEKEEAAPAEIPHAVLEEPAPAEPPHAGLEEPPPGEIPHASLEAPARDAAGEIPHAGLAPEADAALELQLEVVINDLPTEMIAGFRQEADGGLSATRASLRDLRIASPGEGADDEWVALSAIEGLTTFYDETQQRVALTLPPENLIPTRIRANGGGAPPGAVTPSAFALAVNYGAYAAAGYDADASRASLSGASLMLDARATTPLGILRQSGFVNSSDFRQARAVRLDTSFEYADAARQLNWRAGDVISSSLPWTRSIRMGGGQLQRDFSSRPDLITMPLPAFSGTAALPSTLEVYVGNTQTYSADMPQGPFTIDDVPVLAGDGTTRLVLRDSTGREQVTEQEFYSSPDMLAKGLLDFSLEAGLARTDAGNENFAYGRDALASASLRYGLTGRITMMAHAEYGAGLINGSLGALTHLGPLGLLTAAAGYSQRDAARGELLHASWSKRLGPLSLSAGTTRIFGAFKDLGDVTARELTKDEIALGYKPATQPRAIDHVTVGTLLPWEASSLSIGLANLETRDEKGKLARDTIGQLSFSQGLPHGIAAYLSGFMDVDGFKSYGVFAGVSMQLGRNANASSNASASGSGLTGSLAAQGTGETASGKPYAWRLAHSENRMRSTGAAADYQAELANLRGEAILQGKNLQGNVSADGAVTLASGGLYLSRPITDSFAVVDAGAPGVKVMAENQPVGVTGRSGKLLVPSLRGFEANSISIDTSNLPLDADVPVTSMSVRPMRGSGVLVAFGAQQKTNGAIVILQGPDGKPLEIGTGVKLGGEGAEFTVGYDGETYIQGLEGTNTLTAETSSGTCTATFDYAPDDGQQAIGPVPCI